MEQKLNITYTERDGQLYPNIRVEDKVELGRFGRQWLAYLRHNYPQRHLSLRMQCKLLTAAKQVEAEALERQERIYQQNLQENPPPQTEDTLEKARHLNSLRLAAEEIVMREIVLTPR